MARTLAKSGIGHLLKVGDGAGNGAASSAYTTISEGQMLDGPKIAADALEATNTDSDGGWKEFVVAQLDGGQLTWNGNYVANSAQEGMRTDLVAGTLRNFQVYSPTNTAKTYSFTALIVSFNPKFDYKGVIGLSLTLRISGAVTVA